MHCYFVNLVFFVYIWISMDDESLALNEVGIEGRINVLMEGWLEDRIRG